MTGPGFAINYEWTINLLANNYEYFIATAVKRQVLTSHRDTECFLQKSIYSETGTLSNKAGIRWRVACVVVIVIGGARIDCCYAIVIRYSILEEILLLLEHIGKKSRGSSRSRSHGRVQSRWWWWGRRILRWGFLQVRATLSLTPSVAYPIIHISVFKDVMRCRSRWGVAKWQSRRWFLEVLLLR